MLDDTKVNRIIELYKQGLSIQQVKKLTHTGSKPIGKILKERGLTRSISFCRTKYKFDHSFFSSIDNEAKAYFLGIMFSDGNVSINHGTFVIRLVSKDKVLLNEFVKQINGDMPIREEIHNKFKTSCYKVQLASKLMYDNLCALGCIPRKSLVMEFPDINKSLLPHFIRGYFDGDGTVGLYNNTKSSIWKRLISGFCSGSKGFLEELVSYLPVSNKNIIGRKNTNVWTVSFSVEDSLRLHNYLYTNSTIYLSRKKDIFDNHIKERRSTTTIDNPSKRRWRIKV